MVIGGARADTGPDGRLPKRPAIEPPLPDEALGSVEQRTGEITVVVGPLRHIRILTPLRICAMFSLGTEHYSDWRTLCRAQRGPRGWQVRSWAPRGSRHGRT